MIVNFTFSSMSFLTSINAIAQQFEVAVSYSRCDKNNGTGVKCWINKPCDPVLLHKKLSLGELFVNVFYSILGESAFSLP